MYSRLGLFNDCLPGSPFYLGLDGNHGSATDLVAVLLHEIGHGLGFQSFSDEETGEYYLDTPSIWDHFMTDNKTNKVWTEMTPAERVANAVSGDGMSWGGPEVTSYVPEVLGAMGVVNIGGPTAGATAGNYQFGEASFGAVIGSSTVTGQLMPVVDQATGKGLACEPLSAVNAKAVRGNIAMVDRGTCAFVIKAANVQAAGAIGMIVVDNAPGDPAGMSGTDPNVTIPAVRITQASGEALRARLAYRNRTQSGIVATFKGDNSKLAGADAQKRILMYTPTTFEPGSSVSHYTTSARPNQLMEPAINGDLTHEVKPPKDLTLPLLHDIGW